MLPSDRWIVTPNSLRARINNASRRDAALVDFMMPIYTLQRTQVIPMPLGWSWKFFSDPANLSKITPPTREFRVESDCRMRFTPV
jgi:hypothetical protein